MAFGAHAGGTVAGALTMLILRRKTSDESAPSPRPSTLKPIAVSAPIDPPGALPVYLSIDGNQTGPFPPGSVRGMIELGSIPSTAYFWREDMTEWRPVSEF